MRIVSYREAGRPRLGVVLAGGVLDVARAAEASGAGGLGDPDAFFGRGLDALADLRRVVEAAGDGPFVGPVEGLELLPAVPSPEKIICVGLNYRRHAAEAGLPEPSEPVLFAKYANTLAPHGATVDITGMPQVDYEAELAVVVGRTMRHVDEVDALDYVLGYACANDVSERDLQNRSSQWLLGKTPDGFFPLGPFVVTADEAGDPAAMPVRGWLNGDLRQDSSSADLIFSVSEILAYVSRYMTLVPGDVVSTGTPEGVVLGRPQRDWVRPGDRYEVEVGSLGRLVTVFA
jgi:2-keto-4-pentenoate hydratase/2-oxohepta-3-ene-1,7-dioic acid hydratase in catechol pathway